MSILLVVSDNPTLLAFSKAASGSAGRIWARSSSVQEIRSKLTELTDPVLFIDVAKWMAPGGIREVLQTLVGEGEDHISPDAVHLLCTMSSPAEGGAIREMINLNVVGHLVVCQQEDAESSGQQYGGSIRKGLVNPESLLSAGAAAFENSLSFNLRHTSQKTETVEAVHSFLLRNGFRHRLSSVISTVADELVLNAIFDAAVLAGAKKNAKGQPDHPLLGRSAVEVIVGTDGKEGAISVIDHFGSLNRAAVLTHVAKIFSEEFSINTANPTIGIGLANAFRMGFSLSFCTQRGVRTEATVFFQKSDFVTLRHQTKFVSIRKMP